MCRQMVTRLRCIGICSEGCLHVCLARPQGCSKLSAYALGMIHLAKVWTTSLVLHGSQIKFWACCSHSDFLLVCTQRAVLDFVALTQGCACSLRPAVHKLTRNPPLQWLCSFRNVVMLPATLAVLVCIFASIVVYLEAQDWYHGGTGGSYKVLLLLKWHVTMPCSPM